jgi:hypothetical protein
LRRGASHLWHILTVVYNSFSRARRTAHTHRKGVRPDGQQRLSKWPRLPNRH